MEIIIVVFLLIIYFFLALIGKSNSSSPSQPRSQQDTRHGTVFDPKEVAGKQGEKMLLQALHFTNCSGHILCNLKVPTKYNVTEID